MATLAGKRGQLLHDFKVSVTEYARPPGILPPAVFGKRSAFPIFARQESVRQRKIRNKRNVQTAAFGNHLGFRSTLDQAVLILNAHKPGGAGPRRSLPFA